MEREAEQEIKERGFEGMFTIGIYDHANWETKHMMQAIDRVSERASGR